MKLSHQPSTPCLIFDEKSVTLMQLAVNNVWLMPGEIWYTKKDGVAMGAALAVVLANIWINKMESSIACDNPQQFHLANISVVNAKQK